MDKFEYIISKLPKDIKKLQCIIVELRSENLALGISKRTLGYQIENLQAVHKHTVADNVDLVRQLAAVNKVIAEADTFALNLSLPQVIRRLKTALQQGNDDG